MNCNKLNELDLNNFNTSNVKDMSYMFCGCGNLKGINLSAFDTSKVDNMCCMFSLCSSLISLDLSKFNTNNVSDMNSMFACCCNLKELNTNSINTNSAKYNMKYIFLLCKNLDKSDIHKFLEDISDEDIEIGVTVKDRNEIRKNINNYFGLLSWNNFELNFPEFDDVSEANSEWIKEVVWGTIDSKFCGYRETKIPIELINEIKDEIFGENVKIDGLNAEIEDGYYNFYYNFECHEYGTDFYIDDIEVVGNDITSIIIPFTEKYNLGAYYDEWNCITQSDENNMLERVMCQEIDMPRCFHFNEEDVIKYKDKFDKLNIKLKIDEKTGRLHIISCKKVEASDNTPVEEYIYEADSQSINLSNSELVKVKLYAIDNADISKYNNDQLCDNFYIVTTDIDDNIIDSFNFIEQLKIGDAKINLLDNYSHKYSVCNFEFNVSDDGKIN